jgi:hypothetical protein
MSDKPFVISQEFKITFTQDADCCSNEDQFITVKTDNGGGGDFFVIETQRWAFDCIEDLVRILYEFKNKHDKIKIKDVKNLGLDENVCTTNV